MLAKSVAGATPRMICMALPTSMVWSAIVVTCISVSYAAAAAVRRDDTGEWMPAATGGTIHGAQQLQMNAEEAPEQRTLFIEQ